MTKYEFIHALRDTLENAVGASKAEEHVRYYENYINEQIQMGYSEAQVLAELGDPRSIAHNIIDGIQASSSYQSAETYTAETEYSENQGVTGDETVEKLKKYGKLAAIILVIFIVLIALTRIIVLALPTILTFAVIVWILKKISGQ